MTYSCLTYTLQGRTAVVTLNRAERRNALDDIMMKEIADVFTVLNRNTTARIVVLRGSGSAFCAGMDLAYLQSCAKLSHEQNLEDAKTLSRMLQLVHQLKKPVIAMVNGPALGGGCGLAAACDFVFAAKENATLGVPEVRLGFLPAVILPYLIARMGYAQTREFVLRGEVLRAEEAKARGLATAVADDSELEATVMQFAEKFSRSTSPSSITLTKDLFARLDSMTPREHLDYAAHLNALARKTDDFKRGLASFLKKERLEW